MAITLIFGSVYEVKTMASFKILERTDDLGRIDATIKNKWNWVWTEVKDANNDFLSEYIGRLMNLCCFLHVVSKEN